MITMKIITLQRNFMDFITCSFQDCLVHALNALVPELVLKCGLKTHMSLMYKHMLFMYKVMICHVQGHDHLCHNPEPFIGFGVGTV
jgi:hypothetical protein